jgi:ABC-type multidrug transport system ATPase subunit
VIDLDEASVIIDETVLLPPTSITISAGEVVALRGPNGSGKTTVLRLIAGQIAPASGSVQVLGSPPMPRDPRHRARVAGMIGHPPFARDMTVIEHATLIGVTWNLPVDQARASASTMLAAFGIGHLAERFAHELSSGQTQLVALSLTLLRPADILLLDEPEQRLDKTRIGVLTDVLRERHARGTTLVVATHSDRVARELDARPVWLGAA